MIKGAIQQVNRNFVNIYVPNIEAPKYVKQIFININGEIHSNTVRKGF